MEDTANNPAHGYDQAYRWGERGDYDCSSAVITAWEQAGVPVKSRGAVYTGNMYEVFLSCGFKDVTAEVIRSTGAGLVRGDVLLNIVHHTAMYCGNGLEVEASVNEKGKATGGAPGDQGKEFLIRYYRNYPWDKILRYAGDDEAAVDPPKDELTDGTDHDFDKDAADGVSSTPKWVGRVTASLLNVRQWAGTEYPNITSYPVLAYGDLVDVCDGLCAYDGSRWYFVRIAGEIFGFVSANYIERA